VEQCDNTAVIEVKQGEMTPHLLVITP